MKYVEVLDNPVFKPEVSKIVLLQRRTDRLSDNVPVLKA